MSWCDKWRIACGTYLHMQRAGKSIDNLALFMCMARQFNFFPSGFLDADGLLTRLLYQRNITFLFLIHSLRMA